MRLLFLVPYAPTPIRTRPYHLLRELVRSGHTITLATLYADTIEYDALAQWRAAGVETLAARLSRTRALKNVLGATFTAAPLQAAYCWQPELFQMILQTLKQNSFDAIHVEHLRGAWYGLRIQEFLRKQKRATPVIWDSVDCITHLFEQASRASASITSRMMTRAEIGRTRAYEKKLAQTFAHTTVVSKSERAAFCEILETDCERVSVVPNGVDVEFFTPPSSPRDPATILFSGKMSYHANVTAAFYLLDEIMPRVWNVLPHARVQIVGQNPPPSLLRRANERVQVIGYVPDMRPYLQRATVACAPIQYGAGTQNKVLEAMACGTAVVATPQAVAALDAQSERDVLIGTTPEQLGAQVTRVLTEQNFRARLEQRGRTYVETHHVWQHSASRLTEIYSQARHDATQAGGV